MSLTKCNSVIYDYNCKKLANLKHPTVCILLDDLDVFVVLLPILKCYFFLSSCSYSTRHSHPVLQYFTVPPFHLLVYKSNILAVVLPLMNLRPGINSLITCSMQHQLPPLGKSSKFTCLQKPIHHGLPCHPNIFLV